MPDPATETSPGNLSRRAARHRGADPHRCQVCGNTFTGRNVLPAALVRDSLAALITARLPAWDPAGFICRNCLNAFRTDYVRAEMEKDRGEITALEEEVVRSLHDGAIVADNLNREFDSSLTSANTPPTRWRSLAAAGASSSRFSS